MLNFDDFHFNNFDYLLDVQKIVSNGDADFELTEDALLQKLKQLETTGSRNILNGSIYSGTIKYIFVAFILLCCVWSETG